MGSGIIRTAVAAIPALTTAMAWTEGVGRRIESIATEVCSLTVLGISFSTTATTTIAATDHDFGMKGFEGEVRRPACGG